MRKAYDICQPSGELGEEESALAQCFMAIAGMVYKMNGTDAPDTDTMNRRVAKMVEEALRYNNIENVLEEGEQTDVFSPEFEERLSDVKMPATKLELLIKLLRKQITEYGKTNEVASHKYSDMLEATIEEYHNRRRFLSEQDATATQEATAESIISNATQQALSILKAMQADRDSFRKLGLTFEEKAFYDILVHLRDKYNFVYGEDKLQEGIMVNAKCKSLAAQIRKIIDTKSSFADWLNNQRVRDQLKLDIKICLVKNGYPPQYTPEVFRELMGQVENFKENETSNDDDSQNHTMPTNTDRAGTTSLYIHPDMEEVGDLAAEDFLCYSWNKFDRQISDFFEGKTVLIGCAKDKRHLEWILAHNLYNVRIGKSKGSVADKEPLFDQTAYLLLYDAKNTDALKAFTIKGHREMSKEEMRRENYPNPQRKSYMVFSISPLDKDLRLLAERHLIDRILQDEGGSIKGMPIFIEP